MPIPRGIKSGSLVGSKLATARRIRTGDCAASVPAGMELVVKDAGSRGFMLESPSPCPCCGISIRLDAVTRSQVFMSGDPDAPYPENVAFWNSRKEHNDHTWCSCSNCNFTVENYKAVKQGISSDDYVGVKWKFCPGCGKRMAVRTANGKVVL